MLLDRRKRMETNLRYFPIKSLIGMTLPLQLDFTHRNTQLLTLLVLNTFLD